VFEMNRSDPIRLPAHRPTGSVGMDRGEMRRQLTISVWLVGLLSVAIVAVLATRPAEPVPSFATKAPVTSIAAAQPATLTR
jgi:hypothetical protein